MAGPNTPLKVTSVLHVSRNSREPEQFLESCLDYSNRFSTFLAWLSNGHCISNLVKLTKLLTLQVEFEGAKHEITRLREELELYQQQVDELTKLKRIAEKQMEEALESLQVTNS